MRYIENFELREWVKDNLRKTIFQKAHALSIQTGCEILVKLRDDNDELTGQQCYATGSLQKSYLNNVLRKDAGEFFVSGETGQPLVDQGIQIDEPPRTSSELGTPIHPASSPTAVSESSVTETTSQFTSIQAHNSTSKKHSSSQVADFHSSVDAIDYHGSGAKDDPMDDDEEPPGEDGDDEVDVVTRIKLEPSDDIDIIPSIPSSGDNASDTDHDMKTELDDIDDDLEAEGEDVEPSSPVSEGSGNQEDGRQSVKPFQCSICSKSFRSIQVLQKHSQTLHRHGIVKSQGFKLKPSPGKRKRGNSSMTKHGGKVPASPQTLLHACSMCSQRFTESILLNDHIVKVHLNMDAINPSSSAPFTQSQPPGTPQFGNVQGIVDPQIMPQITSVSSLQGPFPQTPNPIPSTVTSSYSQSPMGPGPSTSDGSGSTQGTMPYIPRYISGPTAGTLLLGGNQEMVRDLAWYEKILTQVSWIKRQRNEERGRLLCMKLLRCEFPLYDLCTKNVTGRTRDEENKIIKIARLDAHILTGIFSQAKLQFPGFCDSYDDSKGKTVKELNIICKRARSQRNQNMEIMHLKSSAEKNKGKCQD